MSNSSYPPLPGATPTSPTPRGPSSAKPKKKLAPIIRTLVPSLTRPTCISLLPLQSHLQHEFLSFFRQKILQHPAQRRGLRRTVIFSPSLLGVINLLFSPGDLRGQGDSGVNLGLGIRFIYATDVALGGRSVQSAKALVGFVAEGSTTGAATGGPPTPAVAAVGADAGADAGAGTGPSGSSSDDCDVDEFVFFVRSTEVKDVRDMCDLVRRIEKRRQPKSQPGGVGGVGGGKQPNSNRRILVYLVPRETFLCRNLIERHCLLGKIDILGSYGFDLVPVDTGLCTLALGDSFRRMRQSENRDVVYLAARAILKFESIFGRIKKRKPWWIGKEALAVAEKLNDLRIAVGWDVKREEVESEGEGAGAGTAAAGAGQRQQQRKRVRYVTVDGPRVGLVDEVIIIDRSVDLVTPLLTPLTYGALVNALYTIRQDGLFDYSQIPLPGSEIRALKEREAAARRAKEDARRKAQDQARAAAAATATAAGGRPRSGEGGLTAVVPPPAPSASAAGPARIRTLILNDDDEVFARIRYRNISHVATQIRAIVTECNEFERRDNYSGDLKKMREFMDEIPKYNEKKKNLNCHLNIANHIKAQYPFVKRKIDVERFLLFGENVRQVIEFIENLIVTNSRLEDVLSLMCLFSLTMGGIREEKMDFLTRQLIHTYGIGILLVLKGLREVGLLKPYNRAHQKQFATLRKRLKLFEQDQAIIQMTSRYVFSGYGALSIRMMEELVFPQRSIIPATPGSSRSSARDGLTALETLRSLHPMSVPRSMEELQKQLLEEDDGRDRKVYLVLFLGGCCRAEVASLRFIEQRDHSKRFVIITTEVMSNFMAQFSKEYVE